jgi:hypothetical protein
MEELKPELVGEKSTIGTFCAEMYHRTIGKNPVTGLFNGVRIIMFQEKE